ncbi:MAG: hypothetical protein JKY54_13035 [Flavobacteriales bacterium]|nr:hypothetical protein [Flavobacteriales bacterium]
MPRRKDERLLDARNRKIKNRFDFLYNTKRMRFDDVINKLKWEEFFIEEETIIRILKAA